MVRRAACRRCARSSGISRPWSTALRRMCSNGSMQLVQHVGVDQDVLADDDELGLFAEWPPRSGARCAAGAARSSRPAPCGSATSGARSSRIRRCCWCRMPARPASSSLRPRPRSRESVVSSISARVIYCTSLYWSISSESNSPSRALPTACSLWRAATPRISTEFSSSNSRFWMERSCSTSWRECAGGGFQFLFELADLDRELAHHAHQVVEQLRGHARHRPSGVAPGRDSG